MMKYTCGCQNEVMLKYLYTKQNDDETGLINFCTQCGLFNFKIHLKLCLELQFTHTYLIVVYVNYDF